MPKLAKIVLRALGIINCVALLLGASFLLDSVHRVLTGHITEPHDASYFRSVFALMTLIEVVFIGILFATAIRFIQAKLSAANLYSLTVLTFIVYSVATGALWRAGRGIGASIAAASGGTGSGTAPFEFLLLVPFLYPLASMIFVQLLRQRYHSPRTLLSA